MKSLPPAKPPSLFHWDLPVSDHRGRMRLSSVCEQDLWLGEMQLVQNWGLKAVLDPEVVWSPCPICTILGSHFFGQVFCFPKGEASAQSEPYYCDPFISSPVSSFSSSTQSWQYFMYPTSTCVPGSPDLLSSHTKLGSTAEVPTDKFFCHIIFLSILSPFVFLLCNLLSVCIYPTYFLCSHRTFF